MKSKRLSHTLKITRLELDPEVRIQTRNVWLQSLTLCFYFSLFFQEGPITEIVLTQCHSRSRPPRVCLVHNPVSGGKNLTGPAQVNCALLDQLALVRGSRGCRETSESGGKLLGKTVV